MGKAYYTDINEPHIPDPKEVGMDIVRMNSGHDSNIEKELVLETAKQYPHVFFNTSLPNLDFPGPVVLTINGDETCHMAPITPDCFVQKELENLMFVRIRASANNFYHMEKVFLEWIGFGIPVILTFMAYYDEEEVPDPKWYEYKKRHINSYWCPTRELKVKLYTQYQEAANNEYGPMGMGLVKMCGTLDSNWCRDCGLCEKYYWRS